MLMVTMPMAERSTKRKAQPAAAGLLVQVHLSESCLRLRSVGLKPGSRGFQPFIDVLDVLHSFVLHPLHESLLSLLCKYGNAVGPGRASAEHSVEFHSRLGGQLQRFGELLVADSSR